MVVASSPKPRYRLLLRCFCEAVAAHGLKCLLGTIPLGDHLYEIACDIHGRYRRKSEMEEAVAQVEAMAQASLEEVKAQAREVFEEVRAAAPPELASQLAQPRVKQSLIGYLENVPATVRSSLRRPADPTGRSMPRDITLQKPEDFLRLLPPRPPQFQPGDRPVGNWQLEELLGIGGFGEVWKARHAQLPNLEPVALKFCLDESSARYLRHEAGLIDRIRAHSQLPGVVQLRDAFLDAKPPCLVYEFINGGDLGGLLCQWQNLKPLERIHQATRLIQRLAGILAPLHRLNPAVVHRDLKPTNILLVRKEGNKGDVKIADFGLGGLSARQALAQASHGVSRGDLLSQTLRGSHTPLYASPEQIRGQPPNPRDDVHALGVMWYQLLVCDPQRGVGPDFNEDLRDLGVDEKIVEVLRGCVTTRPERRFADCQELADKLGMLPLSATPSSGEDLPPTGSRSTSTTPSTVTPSGTSPPPSLSQPARIAGSSSKKVAQTTGPTPTSPASTRSLTSAPPPQPAPKLPVAIPVARSETARREPLAPARVESQKGPAKSGPVGAKAHVNVGTIGHIDHGKTTLTAAILARLAYRNKIPKYKSYQEIAVGGIVRDPARVVTVSSVAVEYETQNRHYAHIDCPGHVHFTKNTITGAAQMDCAILVVSASDGPMPQTREHIVLARQAGVNHLVVFLNKCDLADNSALLDLVEKEVRDLLSAYGFPGEKVPFVRGSALPVVQTRGQDPAAGKSVDDLLGVLDTQISVPARNVGGPFLMFVDKIHPIIGRGVVAVGRIEKGQVKIGDPVEIAGLTTEVRKTVVAGIETFRKSLNAGKAGDYVGLLLRGFGSNDVGRGQAIASPGSLSVHSAFQAELYALAKEEGGRHTPFFTGYKPQFYFRTADVPGVITLPPGQEKCRPGDNMAVTVRLPENRPLPIVAGQRFAVRDGGFTVAVGAATGVLR